MSSVRQPYSGTSSSITTPTTPTIPATNTSTDGNTNLVTHPHHHSSVNQQKPIHSSASLNQLYATHHQPIQPALYSPSHPPPPPPPPPPLPLLHPPYQLPLFQSPANNGSCNQISTKQWSPSSLSSSLPLRHHQVSPSISPVASPNANIIDFVPPPQLRSPSQHTTPTESHSSQPMVGSFGCDLLSPSYCSTCDTLSNQQQAHHKIAVSSYCSHKLPYTQPLCSSSITTVTSSTTFAVKSKKYSPVPALQIQPPPSVDYYGPPETPSPGPVPTPPPPPACPKPTTDPPLLPLPLFDDSTSPGSNQSVTSSQQHHPHCQHHQSQHHRRSSFKRSIKSTSSSKRFRFPSPFSGAVTSAVTPAPGAAFEVSITDGSGATSCPPVTPSVCSSSNCSRRSSCSASSISSSSCSCAECNNVNPDGIGVVEIQPLASSVVGTINNKITTTRSISLSSSISSSPSSPSSSSTSGSSNSTTSSPNHVCHHHQLGESSYCSSSASHSSSTSPPTSPKVAQTTEINIDEQAIPIVVTTTSCQTSTQPTSSQVTNDSRPRVQTLASRLLPSCLVQQRVDTPNVSKVRTKKIKPKCEGGLKSQKLTHLVHPLDRSIVGIFTLTIFFTILAIITGAPTVFCLFLILPVIVFFQKLFLCHFSPIPGHEPLSSMDTFWLAQGHITHCLLYIDKGLSLEQLRDVIASRLLSKPELSRLRSRLVYRGLCQSPFWRFDPDFDTIEQHVLEDEVLRNKRALRRRLMRLMNSTAEPLPTDRPLWQIRYCAAPFCNQVILIVRVHQALAQSGLISILTHYLADSVPVPLNPIKPRFGGSTLSINLFRAIIVGPLTFFLWIVWAFTRRNHNYLSKSKEIKSVHWMALDLPRVYRIKQVTRSSLNDVLLSTVAGSIRAYLTKRTNISNPPDLNVSIPIDIKSADSTNNSLVGVNYVLTTSPIPTNTEGAIPRLWEVRHLMEELKTSADTAVMYGAHYLLNRLLPRPLYRMVINMINRNSSLYISNIAGPDSELSIGSHRLIKAYYFLSPPTYCSIVYNMFTFNEKLYVSITTKSKLISNARALAKQFRAQIDLLHSLLSRRRVPGESKRARRAQLLSQYDQANAEALAAIQAQQAAAMAAASAATVASTSTAAGLTLSLYQQLTPVSGGSPVSSASDGTELSTMTTTGQITVDLSTKLHEIQDELNELSEAYDMGDPSVASRYEELKEEFTSLLFEMRRRKSIADYGGQNIMINIESEDDDDNDGELRPPPRRFSVVSIGRRGSIVSSLPSTSRVTPPILSRRSMATTSPEPPSSPEVAFKMETEI